MLPKAMAKLLELARLSRHEIDAERPVKVQVDRSNCLGPVLYELDTAFAAWHPTKLA